MKKGRLISLVAASCCLGTMIATAQTTQVTGTVISMEDNMPVIGASIVVKGTTTGTVTDMDGNFTLEVPSDAHFIQISYVGMEPQELRIKQQTLDCCQAGFTVSAYLSAKAKANIDLPPAKKKKISRNNSGPSLSNRLWHLALHRQKN